MSTRPGRGKELIGLLQLMAHQNPSPSPVPVPMAVSKGVQVGVSFFSHVFVCILKPNRAGRPVYSLYYLTGDCRQLTAVETRVAPNTHTVLELADRVDLAEATKSSRIVFLLGLCMGGTRGLLSVFLISRRSLVDRPPFTLLRFSSFFLTRMNEQYVRRYPSAACP